MAPREFRICMLGDEDDPGIFTVQVHVRVRLAEGHYSSWRVLVNKGLVVPWVHSRTDEQMVDWLLSHTL